MAPHGDDIEMSDMGTGPRNLLGSARPPRTILGFLTLALFLIGGSVASIVAVLAMAQDPQKQFCNLIFWVLVAAGIGTAIIIGVVLNCLYHEGPQTFRLLLGELKGSEFLELLSRDPEHEQRTEQTERGRIAEREIDVRPPSNRRTE